MVFCKRSVPLLLQHLERVGQACELLHVYLASWQGSNPICNDPTQFSILPGKIGHGREPTGVLYTISAELGVLSATLNTSRNILYYRVTPNS